MLQHKQGPHKTTLTPVLELTAQKKQLPTSAKTRMIITRKKKNHLSED
jgi:hypothetical protein